jgi:uncharacterized RDD family membrane protein YckC
MSIVPKPVPEGLSFGGYATSTDIVGVGFWPRVGARVIDTVVHILIAAMAGVIGVIIAVFVAAATGQEPDALIDRISTTTLLSFVFSLLGAVAYQTITEGVAGASLGKRILGFTVIKEDGNDCTLRAALVRSLGYLVDQMFFGWVGYMSMNRSVLQQRHGDGWAKTVVVSTKGLAPEQKRGGWLFIGALLLGILADVAIMMTDLVINAV